MTVIGVPNPRIIIAGCWGRKQEKRLEVRSQVSVARIDAGCARDDVYAEWSCGKVKFLQKPEWAKNTAISPLTLGLQCSTKDFT
jgi:hypothetical protein